jgi:valyl-tRNA synthetase
LLLKTEEYEHNVGHSERTEVPIEPYLSEQWFLKYPASPPLHRCTSKRVKFNFYPERWTKTYMHWMRNIRDWCMSRQLWWGHRIPVWYRGDEIYCGIEVPTGDGWTQDPDVLDTWFSSWLWPFATMGWPNKTETLGKFYPTTDLVTGPDIIFLLGRADDHGGLRVHGRETIRQCVLHRHHPRHRRAARCRSRLAIRPTRSI